MNVAEILAELPKLQADELRAVVSRALELEQDLEPGTVFVAAPELLRAIEEADAEPEDQDIDISEAERIVKSWSTK
jgi:hypothetical protein